MTNLNVLRSSIDIGSNSILLLIARVAEIVKIVKINSYESSFDQDRNAVNRTMMSAITTGSRDRADVADSNTLTTSPFLSDIEEYSSITELGKGINQSGIFSKHSMENTFNTLMDYKKIIQAKGMDHTKTLVTATEAARSVSNFYKINFGQGDLNAVNRTTMSASAKESRDRADVVDSYSFFEKIHNEIGFKVNILSTEGEAYYSSMGVCLGISNELKAKKEFMAIDLGGASTELIKIKLSNEITAAPCFSVSESVSLPIGAVRAQDFLIENREVGESGENKLNDYLDKMFAKEITPSFIDSFKNNKIETVCLAGTFVLLANILFGNYTTFNPSTHGLQVRSADLKTFLEMNKLLSAEKLNENFPCLGKRASNFIGGLMVAKKLLTYLDIDKFEISTYGLKYGTLYEGEIKDEFLFKK
ncbi:MAG: hypothetical protein HQK51_13860 [Oligoflexia bacterium]|nr:hypothetical protein [Oligoflexia bacterium]